MSEMVKRVARAIAEARLGIGCPVDDDDRIAARAAIEAMREPTEHMVDIGACHEDPAEYYKSENELGIKPEGQIAEDVWRAMIDAALTETQPSSSEIAVQRQPEKQDG